mgnify:CR=1 FL=1
MRILRIWIRICCMYWFLRLFMDSSRQLFRLSAQLRDICSGRCIKGTGFEVVLDYNTYVWIAQVIYPRTDRRVYAGSDPDDPKGKPGDGRTSDRTNCRFAGDQCNKCSD